MVVAVRGRRPSATHVDIEIRLGSYSSISGKYLLVLGGSGERSRIV